MAETWPSTIDKDILVDSFSQSAKPVAIRTSVEAGIDKLRRRYTKPIIITKLSMILDFTQYQTLETFFNTTLQGGVLTFNFPDPATGTVYEHRFVSPPTYTPFSPIHYTASMEFERVT